VRLTALTSTKIEGDIVEEFVRHTLRFVDQVIVVDNGSLDAANDVLSELQTEGLPVYVWPGWAVPSSADPWTPNARRAFATFETDYLLMLDVDEFLRAPSRGALEAALAGLYGAHGLVAWTTYLPTPDDDAAEPRVLARIQHRLRHEPRPFYKVFVHRSFAEHAGALIAAGNHGVFDAQDDVVLRIIPDVQLAHIPARSLLQLQSKAVLGWPAFLAMGFTEEQEIAYHWRRLNARLLSDATWDNGEFFRLARQYLDGKEPETEELPELVFDPLPTVERRYQREPPALLPLAMRFTGQIARAYAARALVCGADQRKTGGMADIETSADAIDGSPEHNPVCAAETYGEAYFRFYHTSLGAIPYERSHHWLTFFAIIADEIVRVFRPASVLDAGCAMGLLVEALWDRGVRAEGIDLSNYAIANVRPDMRAQCRAASLTDPIEGTFDLVTCIEVLEHLERADAEAAIANICKVTQTVLFSSTPSDFTEPTHVNVCPPIVWIELFAARGFGPDLLVDGTFLTPHTMIFRKGNPCDSTFLQTYALINRLRTLCAERFAALDLERKNANLAREAQQQSQAHHEAELQSARAAQRQAEAEVARLAEAHAATEARFDVEIQASREALRQAEDKLSLQAQVGAEALAKSAADTVRYETLVRELGALIDSMQRSHSWRLTRPLRLAVISLRDALNQLRRPPAVRP
jgi:hypothetical protein